MTDKIEQQTQEITPSGMERRKEYRLNIRMPITISGVKPDTLESYTFNVLTQNVSRFGASFDLILGVARIGSLLSLAIANRFDAKARVVWTRKSSENMETVGVEFISVTGQWVLFN